MTRLHSEACVRNSQPILDALEQVFDDRARVFEVASGTGQHAAFFASKRPEWTWQPSDVDAEYMASARAWTDELENVLEPVAFDVFEPDDHGEWDGVFCANMIHVAPPRATPKLIGAAAALLRTGGKLCLYGPFRYRERELEPSNQRFEEWLRERFEGGGIREFEAICEHAASCGFAFEKDIEMPSNNHILVFRLES